jgi:cell division initiation protein
MDITPQELRDIEIRESFRGYHRDDVDDLLERAASTIEHLEHQIRVLQERLAAAPAARREPERAPAPAPAPLVPSAPAPVPGGGSDVIQRTLILAQRAADEAVAEAQARATAVTGEAEARAQAMVAEAESTARRIAETERRRIETEIVQLTSTRDALSSDVDALERFVTEYRERIRRAIEAELVHLNASAAAADRQPSRPLLQSGGMIPLSPPPEPAALPQPPEPEPTAALPRTEAPPAAWDVPAEPAFEAPAEPSGGWDAPADPGWGAEESWSTGSEPAAESLDDDAFFASLRDAVRDEEPLGAGGDFDDDDQRRLFRRKR